MPDATEFTWMSKHFPSTVRPDELYVCAICCIRAAFSLEAATVTRVQPSRGGAAVAPVVVSPEPEPDEPSSRVVNQRMPMISSTPTITAAMIGTTLLRLRVGPA